MTIESIYPYIVEARVKLESMGETPDAVYLSYNHAQELKTDNVRNVLSKVDGRRYGLGDELTVVSMLGTGTIDERVVSEEGTVIRF